MKIKLMTYLHQNRRMLTENPIKKMTIPKEQRAFNFKFVWITYLIQPQRFGDAQ